MRMGTPLALAASTSPLAVIRLLCSTAVSSALAARVELLTAMVGLLTVPPSVMVLSALVTRRRSGRRDRSAARTH
jgi:hypothetical protein